jgi:ribosomal protein L7/L12
MTIGKLTTALNYLINVQEELKAVKKYDDQTASHLVTVAYNIGRLISLEFANTNDPNKLTEGEQDMARQDRRIEAIKSVRARTGLGLREAKEMVENWQKENGYYPSL